MTNPIDRPDYNPNAAREPNEELMSRTRADAGTWRAAEKAANDARAVVNQRIVELRQTGHSFNQIREATGINNTGSIQMVLAKAGIK